MKLSPLQQKNSYIHQQTFSIINHLEELIDQNLRKELNDPSITSPSQQKSLFDDESYERTINPFRKETNFDVQEPFDRPSHSIRAIKTIIWGIANLIFGFETSMAFNQTKLEDCAKTLNSSESNWNNTLKKHYSPHFSENILKAISHGRSLTKERIDYQKRIYYFRITFFATAILAAGAIIGGIRFKNFSAVVIGSVSLITSLVTLAYMIKIYVTSQLLQSKIELDLHSSLLSLEKTASQNQII